MARSDATPALRKLLTRILVAWLALLFCPSALAQESAPPGPTEELPAPVDTPPTAAPPPVVENLREAPPGSPGVAGPGLPWQVVLVVQLVAYMLADALPYLGCVVASWLASLLVVAGPALLIGLVLVAVLVPAASVISGVTSAAILQWVGDRLGTKRGRLFFVSLASVVLSAITYTLVIAPIILGMGFFAAALAGALSSYLLIPQLPEIENVPPWLVPLVAYSVPTAGAVLALLILAVGAPTAPIVGFVLRPALVALTYRMTARDRVAGEEQWPPSLFGEHLEAWPKPPWDRTPAAPPKAPPPPVDPAAKPPAPAPSAPAEPAPSTEEHGGTTSGTTLQGVAF